MGELQERDQQLGALRALLGDVEGGSGRLVLVAGDAGSGKSSLVRQFCESMPRATEAMWGLCDPLSTPRPLSPLIDIAPLLGEGVERLVSKGQRAGVFEATRTAFTDRRAPAVVVFEDLHWGDEATLDLVRFIGRRLRGTRVMLICTYRIDELGPDHPLRVLLGDLASVDAVHRLTVPALSLDAVTTLAKGSVLDPVKLHRETGGNAFFVTEVLSDGVGGVPPTVADLVRTRAARLSAAARRTLDATAIAGPRSETALLLQMRDVNADTIDECVASGMLHVAPQHVEFRHELARQAVLGAITPARRLTLHAEVLAIMRRSADRRAHLDRLAHHAEAAGDVEATLEFAPAAAEVAASLKSHRAAAAHYSRAVQCAGALPPRQRAELLEKASYERHLIDDLEEACALSEQSLALFRTLGDQRKVGDGLRWLSRVYWLSGDTAKAERAAADAVTTLEQLPPGGELAMAYSTEAQFAMLARRTEEAGVWGAKAIALARELEETPIVVHALNNVGTARLMTGDRSGDDMLLESLRLALALGLEDDAARAWTNLAATYESLNEIDLAIRYTTEGLQHSVDHDLESNRICLGACLAGLYLTAGRWDEARAQATEMHHPGLSRITKVLLLGVIGRVQTLRGDGDPWPALDRAAELAWGAGDLQFVAPIARSRAEALWFAGRAADIPGEVERPLAMALEVGDSRFIGELSYWMWKAGRLTTPIDHATRPYALQISGDWRAAYEAWTECGLSYEAAMALAGSDDPDDLRAAIAQLAKLGAKPAIAEVTRRLRSLGHLTGIPRGPRPRTRQNPAGLTAREMDILGLLSEGLRNPDIARRLFLS
ncbi:MAG: ATP-binding protein, partial [Candidatus Dormibacteria bacterium]